MLLLILWVWVSNQLLGVRAGYGDPDEGCEGVGLEVEGNYHGSRSPLEL